MSREREHDSEERHAALHESGLRGEEAPWRNVDLGLTKEQAEDNLAWAEGVWERQGTEQGVQTMTKDEWAALREAAMNGKKKR